MPLAKAEGDDSCYHTSLPFSTEKKLLDPVTSVDTLPSTGATRKVFSTGTRYWTRADQSLRCYRILQTQLDHLVGEA